MKPTVFVFAALAGSVAAQYYNVSSKAFRLFIKSDNSSIDGYVLISLSETTLTSSGSLWEPAMPEQPSSPCVSRAKSATTPHQPTRPSTTTCPPRTSPTPLTPPECWPTFSVLAVAWKFPRRCNSRISSRPMSPSQSSLRAGTTTRRCTLMSAVACISRHTRTIRCRRQSRSRER
jgi:hypothetical protein